MRSYLTAISRHKPSVPIQFLFPYLEGKCLDYGCGKGQDYFWLMDEIKPKYQIYAWDPFYKLDYPIYIKEENPWPFKDQKFDTVICTYVLNVLPPAERKKTIEHILSISKNAFFTVRTDPVKGIPFEDGVMTKRQTFQKSFTPDQLIREIPGSQNLSTQPRFTIAYKGEHFLPVLC